MAKFVIALNGFDTLGGINRIRPFFNFFFTKLSSKKCISSTNAYFVITKPKTTQKFKDCRRKYIKKVLKNYFSEKKNKVNRKFWFSSVEAARLWKNL